MDNSKNSGEFSWVGSQKHFIDKPDIIQIRHIVLGRFGGNSKAGQSKNEDGCLIWVDEEDDFEFVMILDAHNTAESAELIIDTIEDQKNAIYSILRDAVNPAFKNLQEYILSIFQNSSFKNACKKIQGETACLIAVRKANFLWWFSIGDCLLYLYHPELVALNEYQQNHRSFYEWVGQVNTFELPVPCYTTGCKELRTGKNHIFLTTDGLVECPNTNFDNPIEIFSYFTRQSNENAVQELLSYIQQKDVRDSTTILSWIVDNKLPASKPSNSSD
ncbi:protein phosphatase 2C domain-containing protein [Fredinandcohnia sp. 179-A 10B2 NHS]|uniref:protein phosphatase 2C domain-containing protein n=1 Tax=Fredinandcohnia sp. 179-A 10B2 NHS TaxID=3235176 RepID=UPI00399FAA43